MATAVVPSRTTVDSATVLLVDDEPSVLSGLQRLLHGSCVVHTATDPETALQKAAELPDLAVVVSDMRMPGMDGAALLSQMRTIVPDAVRVLLTGYTDVEAAVAAINDGAIFRFLWKPCTPDALHACLRDAVAQHRLVTAERQLLEQTLRGSVHALLETLSLANPIAFSRAERITARVQTILQQLQGQAAWEIEIAAMLSQIGAVTLPPSVTEALHAGDTLPTAAQRLVERLPTIAVDLLADVPRLEEVRRSILFQDQRFDGRGHINESLAGTDIPLGARILRVAIDYDPLEARRTPSRDAMSELRNRSGLYDPAVLDALERAVTTDENAQPIEQVRLAELSVGMVLAADIVTQDDVLLCGRGQEVTERLLDRLTNWSQHHRIVEPLNVFHQLPGHRS